MADPHKGDDKRPKCSQCERTGQKCCRTKSQRRFRDGSSAQYEKQFAKDQVWLGFTKNGKSCHRTMTRMFDPCQTPRTHCVSFQLRGGCFEAPLDGGSSCHGHEPRSEAMDIT